MTMYRGTVFSAITDCSHPYYMQEAAETSIELDGVPLVNLAGMLLPAKGWHRREADAKADVRTQLIRHIGQLQAVVDRLADEILHEDLLHEEVTS